VDLPLAYDVKVVARDRAYGLELGDFDVPKIVSYTVGGQG
jgi:hypothetical protein